MALKKQVAIDYDAQALASKQAVAARAEKLKHILTPEFLAEKLSKMPEDQRRGIVESLERLKQLQMRDNCRLDFLEFKRLMWPGYLHGPHFDTLAKIYHRIDKGEAVRVIVNIPPRHGKSEDLSYMFPSWYVGKHPDAKVIQVSNIKSLSESFGSKVRNLMMSEDYQTIFPGVKLAADTKAKGRWNTTKGGSYYAAGVGGTIIGRGADLWIIDDPHSDQEINESGNENNPPNKEDMSKVYNWFTSNRGRLQPGGSILIVMQRWATFDLTGRLVERMKLEPNGDQWEVIEMPALLEKTDDNGKPVVNEYNEPEYLSLFPALWPVDQLLKLKASTIPWKWASMYMQNPGAKEGAIVKREWWKIWGMRKDGTIDEKKAAEPPECFFIIQSWDMAATANTRSDYSACTTWGVFNVQNTNDKPVANIILLNAIRGRWEFPQLKQEVAKQYRLYQVDSCIVEAKSAGIGIIQEFRQMGVPMMSYSPSGNQWVGKNDKVARANAISSMVESGMVWVPPYQWAEMVINELAEMPHGQNDDLADTATQALSRFRNGGFIRLPTDEDEDDDIGQSYRKVVAYY